jgi:hypothetical protein
VGKPGVRAAAAHEALPRLCQAPAARTGRAQGRLPCEVVGTTEREDSVILHLRFEALAPPQVAFLRRLVTVAENELVASYLRMAS